MKEPVKYRLYDTDTQRELGIYTGVQISRKIGIKTKQISAYAKSRSKVKGRYIVEKVEEMKISELLEEWDRVTQAFRRAWGKIGR